MTSRGYTKLYTGSVCFTIFLPERAPAFVSNAEGKQVTLEMGCYGFGVSRIVAASIEQNYDEKGIIWPDAIAPFRVGIIALSYEKSDLVKKQSDHVYDYLMEQSIDVLLDDRKVSPGVKFADMELIGIPHLLVLGQKNLKNSEVEYIDRKKNERKNIQLNNLYDFLSSLM